MELIFGTKNPSKLEAMKRRVSGLDIELVGLDTLSFELTEPDEAGKDPVDNAIIKALGYYHQIKKPVLSADSGLYFTDVEEADQPGVWIKRIHGKDLEWCDLVDYYSQLATKYGGKLTAHYKNALCLVIDEDHVYTLEGKALESEEFYIVDKPHASYEEGFPLDSLSVEKSSMQYYYDIKHVAQKYPGFETAIKAFIQEHMLKEY